MSDLQKITAETQQIEAAFRDAGYPGVTAYRLEKSYSIYVRVIDDRFRGKNRIDREEMVWPIVQSLPDESQADLTILLLLSPEERDRSPMNAEFENPSSVML